MIELNPAQKVVYDEFVAYLESLPEESKKTLTQDITEKIVHYITLIIHKSTDNVNPPSSSI